MIHILLHIFLPDVEMNMVIEFLSYPYFFSEIQDNDVLASTSHHGATGTEKWSISLEHLLDDAEGVRRFRVSPRGEKW